ncbi:gamma-glutamyltransferase [Micromonospora sp. NPDC006766]|uniref:gamma-glutamyltransferase family protein n=1 Tax=Micromonospora sp. NPDC006766 TaxID=3154778 RepID=UPI0033C01729
MTFTTRPTLHGTFGMVSSTHWLASQAAMGILERGGNAFDAAVTAGFVLHVVEPHLNGPGGEVPAIVATARDRTPKVLCGQGPAPAGATIAHFRSLGMELIPGSGPLAAAVPGAVDAWLLLRDHGTLSLEDVLEPAIGYAGAGHPLVARVGDTVDAVRSLFEEHWPTSAQLWLRDGKPPAAGELFTNPAYARTLQRLVDAGRAAGADREAQIEAARRAWGHGFVAEAIDRFSRQPFQDSSGRPHAGLVTGADLAGYSATWEEPVTLDWHGHTVAKTGFWGQGPVLLETLALLDALDDPAAYDPGTAAGIHAQAEALKLAFADREAWFGDGDVPAKTLLSPEYARERAGLMRQRASMQLRPGHPEGRRPRLPAYVRRSAGRRADLVDPTTGEPTVQADGVTRGDTCHVDVVDRWGNMISATPSGGWLQSSPTIPELGFPLGSRLQMFWLEEGLASSLAPGRRPRTTLSPTMVHRDGEPAWHTTSLPGSFYPRDIEPGVLMMEDRLDEDVLATLRGYGHEVRLSGSWSLGRLCAVTRDPATGVLAAGANARGMQGYACGR